MMYKFNLNDSIHVKLDAKGVEILEKFYNLKPGEGNTHWKSDKIPDFHEFQFHEFADIFGGTTVASYAPYNTNVFIEGKDLKDMLDKVLED